MFSNIQVDKPQKIIINNRDRTDSNTNWGNNNLSFNINFGNQYYPKNYQNNQGRGTWSTQCTIFPNKVPESKKRSATLNIFRQ